MAIRTVEDLQQHLQWAIELEHSTLPPYLTALYSIKDGHERGGGRGHPQRLHRGDAAPDARGEHPQRGRRRAEPRLPGDHAVLPDLPRALERGVRGRRSLKFSKEALEVFLQIERPGEHDGLPEDDNFETIGQFYEAIEEALKRLGGRARRGRALQRRPRAAGHRRPLLRRQRPDHRRHRPRLGARGARGDRRAGRGPAAPGDLGRRPRHVPPRAGGGRPLLPLQRARRRPPLPARRHAAVGPDRRAVRGRLGRASGTMRPNPRTADYPDGSPIRAQMERVQPRVHGVPPPAARVASTAARACSRSRPASCTGSRTRPSS